MENQMRIALLIDAENVSKKYVKLIMDEISEYGVVTYKRVYGDFSLPSAMSWKESLREYAMTPVFQANYTKGKSASDSAMVIDAMDILYSGRVDGFCIVTSDSDFTKLAIRLREAGMFVVGMGEKKTPASLVSACDTFKFLDLLFSEEEKRAKDEEEEQDQEMDQEGSLQTDHETAEKKDISETKPEEKNPSEEAVQDEEEISIPSRKMIQSEIGSIIDSRSDETGWVNLASLGNLLSNRVPGFDPRNYGYRKLRAFVDSYDCFETNDVEDPKNSLLKTVYVKRKPKQRSRNRAKKH